MASKPKTVGGNNNSNSSQLKRVGKSESSRAAASRLGVPQRAAFVPKTSYPRYLLNLFVPLMVDLEMEEMRLRHEEDEEDAAEADRIERLLNQQGEVGKLIAKKLAEPQETSSSKSAASAAAAAAAPAPVPSSPRRPSQ
jgi:hypothetical protein